MRLVLVAGALSVAVGGVFVGVRGRYWDARWQQDAEFGQVGSFASIRTLLVG